MVQISEQKMTVNSADHYCVYCNKHHRGKISEEHFIPQLIGGAECPTILVCERCNSRLGSTTDTLLGHYPFLLLKCSELHLSAARTEFIAISRPH